MHLRLTVLTAATAVSLLSASLASAQPQQQPLVQPANLAYLGKFTLPSTDGTGRGTAEGALNYGGYALGLGPNGQSLYYGCHDWGSRLARVSIPAIGGTGAIVEPCAPIANLAGINPGDPNAKKLGGSLWWNGRLIVSAYSYYDGNGTAVASHFAGGNVATQVGPHRVGANVLPGFVAGYMGAIPQEWRTLLGGPAFTGQCCLSIIARTSYGPSVSVFNPDDVGKGTAAAATPLLGYPEAHQAFGPWNVPNPYFTGVTKIGGVAFPAGTRSVLFIGRHGTTFCYGSGTNNAALAGKSDGLGNVYCYDPVDGSKGSHGYPYKHQIWAYDANDLLAVKQGGKLPWDVRPYAVWTLSEMDNNGGGASMRSATYDPATRRWYVALESGGAPTVHVYEVTSAVVQPPAPGPVGFSQSGQSLVWQPPVGATPASYSLEAGSTPGAVDVGVVTLPASATSYALASGTAGTFYFRLIARYANGTSGASGEVQVVLGGGGGGGTIPAPPANFAAVVSGPNLILSWNAPTDSTVTTVVVDVGSASGTSNLGAGVALGKFGPYVMANPPSGTFYMRLRAINPTGSSAASNEVKVTIGGGGEGTGVPLAPTKVTGTAVSGRRITVTWSKNASGAAPVDYIVEVGWSPGGVQLASAVVKGQTITSGAVSAGTYYIRVRARNAKGVSAPSSEVRVVVR